jgi:antitoxin component of MazEF toxin-antitoxin module
MPFDRDRLVSLTRPHATVAGKIRALAAEGVPRADIARFLGKRYQHVRNVLEDDAQSSGGDQSSGGYVLGKADLSGMRDGGRAFEREDDAARIERRSPAAFWIEVKPDGTLPLPPEIVAVLNAEPGRRVFAKIDDGRLILMSPEAALAEAQALVRKYVPAGRSLSDELIADRRAEAAREEADD